MSSWLIALLFAIGAAGWSYTKLTHANGNPNPVSNYIGAFVAGLIAFVIVFTLFKFILGF